MDHALEVVQLLHLQHLHQVPHQLLRQTLGVLDLMGDAGRAMIMPYVIHQIQAVHVVHSNQPLSIVQL